MSNSPLVNYVKLSPHYDSRGGKKITDITIHHMAGNLSVYQCGDVFQSRPASSNYGIDTQGRVGLYVDEKNASWANSNFASNQRSITIELANDRTGGNWHVSDTAINKCIQLCVDICRRNGIRKLTFTGNTNGNLTAHRMFTATACPGDYLYSKFAYIANEVNKQLGQSGATDLVVDGLFGELSTMKLQRLLGIVEDGWVGGQTNAVKPYIPNWTTAKYNDGYLGSTTIDRLQRYLKNRKYNPGTIDGLCGKNTVIALQKFLTKYGAGTVDGIMGVNTAKAFQRFLNEVVKK